jgi:chromosomal replication initiator protein
MTPIPQKRADPADFDLWKRARKPLKEALGDDAYRDWLQLLCGKQDKECFVLSAPSAFVKDWVEAHYLSVIHQTLCEIHPAITRVLVIVAKNKDTPAQPPGELSPPTPKQHIESVDLLNLSSPLDPRFTFDRFVVGKPNELAYAAARRVSESDKVQFNPLFLYGGVGRGKTHLMHAIAQEIRSHSPRRRVVYLTAEKFMYHFIKALRYKDTVSFKEQFRSVDVLMVDDLQFISGKESTQEEFFHTFNALVGQERQVIVSADQSPSDLKGLEERIRSRLGHGLVADIHPTTYELRLGILESKIKDAPCPVPREVLDFLAHKIVSNVRELEGALTRVIAHATLMGRRVNLDMTQEVLRDLLRACERELTLGDIQNRVCEHFNVRLSDLASPKRTKSIAIPRQIAMYLSKKLTTKSLPEIGRAFGGRDHTTVLHAVRKIEEEIKTQIKLEEDIDLLTRMLQC